MQDSYPSARKPCVWTTQSLHPGRWGRWDLRRENTPRGSRHRWSFSGSHCFHLTPRFPAVGLHLHQHQPASHPEKGPYVCSFNGPALLSFSKATHRPCVHALASLRDHFSLTVRPKSLVEICWYGDMACQLSCTAVQENDLWQIMSEVLQTIVTWRWLHALSAPSLSANRFS